MTTIRYNLSIMTTILTTCASDEQSATGSSPLCFSEMYRIFRPAFQQELAALSFAIFHHVKQNNRVPPKSKEVGEGESLCRGVGERDTLLDVALQTLDGLGQQLLLLIGDIS